MELSIIIVSYNTRELLSQCLESIFRISDKVEFEVIVVDNGSHDNTVAELQDKFPMVKLITNHINKGFGAANNQAIPFAKGRYVLFLNSDTYLGSDTLVKAIEFMDSTPDAGVLGPKLRYPNGDFQPSAYKYQLRPWTTFVDSLRLNKIMPKLGLGLIYQEPSVSSPLIVSWVMGAFLLVRRSVLESIGGFDEQYFMYVEECDLCLQIRQLNFNIYYVPSLECFHYNGASFGKISSKKQQNLSKTRMLLYSQKIYMRKHFGFWGGLCYKILGLTVYFSAIVFWAIVRTSRQGTTAAFAKDMFNQYCQLLRIMLVGMR